MENDFKYRHFYLLHSCGFIIGLLLTFLYANNQIITGDQLQMLHKGYLGANESIWLAFGNAASAVGNVPGTLSALIVGIPLVIWDNPWAPMLFLILLRVIAFFMFDRVISSIFSQPIRLVFLALFWLNPWFLYNSLLYNPAYLCFFTALHFWSAYQLKNKPSFIYSGLHILAIGGAMQLHYSWPVLAIITCCLLYRKMIYLSWWAVISAIGIIFLSLIPYFQEYISNENISRESDRYIGYGAIHVYPVIKAFLYWLRYGSTLFSNKIISDVNFDWLTQLSWLSMIITYTWQALLYLIGVLTLIANMKINWLSFKIIKPIIKRSEPILNDKIWLLLFSFAAVVSVIISSMLSPITFSYWHLIIIYPIALLPILVISNQWKENNKKLFNKLIVVFSLFLILVNLVAANGSNKYNYRVEYKDQVERTIK